MFPLLLQSFIYGLIGLVLGGIIMYIFNHIIENMNTDSKIILITGSIFIFAVPIGTLLGMYFPLIVKHISFTIVMK